MWNESGIINERIKIYGDMAEDMEQISLIEPLKKM